MTQQRPPHARIDLKARLEIEQLRHIAAGGRVAVKVAPLWAIANAVSYSGLVPVLGVVPQAQAITYAVAVCVWSLAAHILIRHFEADRNIATTWKRWSHLFCVNFALGSVIWGLTYFLLWVPGNPVNNQSIHLGVIATSMTYLPLYSSHWRVLLAVQLPSLVLSAIRFGTGGGELDEYILSTLLPFSAIVLLLCRMEHNKIKDSLELSFRSERLAKELAGARDEALRQRYDAQAASQAKSSFLANMSHELRTPLNAIIGFSDMIRSEYVGPVGSRYIDYARDIHDSGQHLLALINDILDISKIEAGRLEIELTPVDPYDAITSALRLTQARAHEKGHAFDVRIEQRCPNVMADPRALKQILVNLLSNAVKFTPKGGRITLEARCLGEAIEFTVSDTGRGIPEEHLARIFEPFEQVDNRYDRSEGGTGLGLALVKGLVELHKGKFEIDSRVDQGTTVRVLLSAQRSSKSAAAA